MTLVVQYSASRKRSGDLTVYSVTEDNEKLACDCQNFKHRQSCKHVIAVQRYRKWRINIPADLILPPPAAWIEREISPGGQTEKGSQ